MKTLRTLFKQDKEKFVVPKSVQTVIPIKTIWEDGIFLVGKNKYASPMNSLGISEETKLLNASGEEISVTDFKPGDAVSVTLKDSFTEETPFYYPIVYEIKLIDQ